MIKLVYGGSGSGKSSFAEQLAVSCGAKRKYYVATMQVYDDEGRAKVRRHQEMRADKGFVTIEQPVDIGMAAETDKAVPTAKTIVLLECVTNLVANEMFPPECLSGIEETVVVARIKSGLEKLFSCADDVVVVSGNVFDDGAEYDESTLNYMRALGAVNTFIASKSDEVYEVEAGIPIKLAHQGKCAELC